MHPNVSARPRFARSRPDSRPARGGVKVQRSATLHSMSDNFRRLFSQPLVVRSQHVAYSVEMVADVAANYNAALDALDMLSARCMLDAFYVHIRLLAEFLIHKTSAKDFGPADFGIAWDRPESEAAGRLGEAWDVASKYVVHFGHRRVPTDIDDLAEFTVDGAYFRQLATDALEVYTTFVKALAEHAPEWREGARIPDPDHEPDAWLARTYAEAIRELRAAERDARAKLAS